MNKEKISLWANICILAISASAALFFGVKFIFPVLLPFLIAWSCAFITRKPADFISDKMHMPKKVVRVFISLVSIITVVGGIIFIIIKIVSEAWDFLNAVTADGSLVLIIDKFFNSMGEIFGNLPLDEEIENRLIDAALGILSGLLGNAGSFISGVAGAIPKIILFIVITAISSVYFSIDLENVNKYVHKLLPKKVDDKIIEFKNTSLKVTFKYLRSYLLIMLLTFSVMFFGLSVIGIRYALLMAFIIAALDILPVLGIGTVLIPWGIFMLISGNTKIGVGLLILYGVGMILRQVAEPRIVGGQLGIHPLATLLLMYIGYSFFGLFGLLLIPFFTVILNSFFNKNSLSEVEQ